MRRTAKNTLTVLTAACAALTLWAAAAQAAATHPYIGSFEPSSGPFGQIAGIAVDQSTQDVYVYDDSEGGRIYKFDADGEPVDFSGLGANVIENAGATAYSPAEGELAVDESSGPDQGDIYVSDGGEVAIYGAAGARLGSLTGGETCGVAVDAAGHVYVGVYPASVKQYVPASNPVTNEDYVSSLWGLHEVCNVAIDGAGDVYAASYGGGVRKYEASQFNTEEVQAVSVPAGAEFDVRGWTLAAERSGSSVYVDEGEAIAEYDGNGEPSLRDSFGDSGTYLLGESYGVAVNETSGNPHSGDVYAGSAEGRVYVYGPSLTTAEVDLEEPTGVGTTSATLHGTVDPLGLAVTSCVFEYWVERESEAASVACTPSPGSGNGRVEVSAAVGGLFSNTTYHYRLAAIDADGAAHSGGAKFTTLQAPPVLAGEPVVSNVRQATVLLTPTVDDGNSPSTLLVQFAAEGSYAPGAAEPYAAGTSTPSYELPAASGPKTTRPLALAGLLLGTVYHYRVVVTNAAGTTYGQDHTFTTAAPTPPAVETGAASSVNATTAVLSGVVLTQGLQTSYEFQVGTDPSYSGAEIFGNAGQSAAPHSVSTALQFLVPGTTYHYRLVATNVDGTTYGPDMTFTTPGVPAPIAQPLATPLISTPTFQFPDTSGAVVNPAGKAKKRTGHRKARKHRRAKSGKRKAHAGHRGKGGRRG